jgi:16S rRNA (adenine1518-N6/adenine1519-N6)-dimethyltransferase
MPNKSLGQHWLKDPDVLADIADLAELTTSDTVLEVGPGLGTLTSRLLARAGRVVAVEFDTELARKLPGQFPGKNLEVIHQDILQFDTYNLPVGYKVVANVPYYITSKIIQHLSESSNPPKTMVLLVQKEVAERKEVVLYGLQNQKQGCYRKHHLQSGKWNRQEADRRLESRQQHQVL